MGTGPTPSESFRLTFSPKPAFSTLSSLVTSRFCLYAQLLWTWLSLSPSGPQLHFCPYPLHPVLACCCCLAFKLCPTLCNPVDCSLPGSSVHGIFQVRILEWVAISFSRRNSQPRWIFTTEPPGKPMPWHLKLVLTQIFARNPRSDKRSWQLILTKREIQIIIRFQGRTLWVKLCSAQGTQPNGQLGSEIQPMLCLLSPESQCSAAA